MGGDLFRELGRRGGARGPPTMPVGRGLDDERTFLAEADHRIANHLALLRGYVRLKATELARHAGQPSRESVLLLLEGVGTQIDAVGRLHRSLAGEGQPASNDVGEMLRELCAPFASGRFGPIDVVEDCAPGCRVAAEEMLPLTHIVSEVIANAAKHGQSPNRTGSIRVRCRTGDAGSVLVEVIDDGPGLPDGFDPRTGGGLGFRLLRSLGRQIGALIAFHSTAQGLRFRLILPPARSR